jgi:hypothetical protein
MKLTETTKDKIQAASDGGMPMQVMLQEPFPTQAPVVFPSIPLPPKAKKERKAKAPPQMALPEKKPLKIALVGTAPSSRMLAPYNDPSWTIWACSPGNMGQIPRFDAWFEVHGTNLFEPENKGYAPQYIHWMTNLTVPLYMHDQRVCSNALSIPKDDLIQEFSPYFFTSSFAWMMAMAIQAGAEEIMLFGIDMASREEYIIQRPGAYHFFIEGAKRGIRMSAPHESDIMQPPGLYGYSDVTPFGRKLRARRDELKERIAPAEQQLRQISDTVTYLKGALEDNDYMLSIHLGVQDNSIGQQFLDALVEKNKGRVATPQPPVLTLPSQG